MLGVVGDYGEKDYVAQVWDPVASCRKHDALRQLRCVQYVAIATTQTISQVNWKTREALRIGKDVRSLLVGSKRQVSKRGPDIPEF